MASLKVVVVDVVANSGPGFLDVVPFRQVGFLILEGMEPPLDPDVVSPTGLAIHALAYMLLLEEFCATLLAGELVSWIRRVQDLWSRHRNAFLQASIQALVSSVSSSSHPTIQRLCQSMMAVRYRKPCFIGM